MNKEEITAKINLFLVDEFEVDADDIEPEANLKDIGTNLLSQCGAHYLHSTGEIWVCPNIKDSELYRVTGINENSWKIEKIAGTGSNVERTLRAIRPGRGVITTMRRARNAAS